MPLKVKTVIVTWNGTNNKIVAFHETQSEARDRMLRNWRLYAQRVPEGKYQVGDELDNFDLLDEDLQL